MLNHIEIMGNLVADPEMRTTNGGVSVCSFCIACERDYAAYGAKKDADFIECVAWREKAEFVCRCFTKGMPIIVSGRLQIRKWEDRDGNRRVSAEIIAENLYFAGGEKRQAPSTDFPEIKTDFVDAYEGLGLDTDGGILPF